MEADIMTAEGTFMSPPARMTAASMLVSQIPTAPRNTILE